MSAILLGNGTLIAGICMKNSAQLFVQNRQKNQSPAPGRVSMGNLLKGCETGEKINIINLQIQAWVKMNCMWADSG